MFNECLYRYLNLSVLGDGSLLSDSFSFRWIVRRIGFVLGRFGSEIIVQSGVVCPVILGLFPRCSGFWDGVV